MTAIQCRESVMYCGPCAFESIALSPCVTRKGPAQFEAMPILGIQEAEMADEAVSAPLDYRPEAVATELPVPDVPCHLPPGVHARQGAGPNVAHDLRIGADLRVSVEITGVEGPKVEAVGGQFYHGVMIDNSLSYEKASPLRCGVGPLLAGLSLRHLSLAVHPIVFATIGLVQDIELGEYLLRELDCSET